MIICVDLKNAYSELPMNNDQTLELDPSRSDLSPSSPSSPLKKSIQDFSEGILSWRVWLLLGWQDIRTRYRRSQLGPLWLTISMAVQIYTIGFLYGNLLGIDLKLYYPYLAGGLLSWSFISTVITDGSLAFVSAENYLRQMKISYSVFVMRVLSRNLIIFFHNIFVIVPIILIFHLPVNCNMFTIIPGLLIMSINGFGFGMLLAMLGSRYRDINQLIQNIVQIAFFMTPVMWTSDRLPPQFDFLVIYNPFAQFLNLIREPLMGNIPSTYCFVYTTSIGIASLVLAFVIFNQFRKEIIYWL